MVSNSSYSPVMVQIHTGDQSDTTESPGFARDLKKTVNDRYVNVVITFVFVASLLYLTTVAVFQLSVVHPLSPSSLDVSADASRTVLSLVVLLLSSLALGWILTVIKLPALLGALLSGIVFRNVDLLSNNFSIDSRWEVVIRSLSLACIIVRWGMGLDANAIRDRPVLPLLLGLVSPLAETAAITLSAHLIFGMNLSMAIICGFILAAVSPAITVPVMLDLQKQKRGEERAVPTTILAASSIDNLLCIAAFSAAISLVFSESEASSTVLWVILQLIVGVALGVIVGLLLWFFPLVSSSYASAIRSLLLAVATSCAVLGGNAVGWTCGGIVAAILLCFIGTTKWKTDSENGITEQNELFASLWNLVFMPLLFALIGMKFDIEALDSSTVWCALCLIGLGALARFVSALFLSSCSLSISENIFVAFSLLPKATVQAALGPSLLSYTSTHPLMNDQIQIIVSSCIVSILVTATIGQLILQLLGPILLSKEKELEVPTYVYADNYEPKWTSNNGNTVVRETVITKKMFINGNDDSSSLSLRM